MISTLYRLGMRALFASLFVRGGRRKATPARTVVFVLLFAYVAGAMMVAIGVMFAPLLDAFYAMGAGWMYFAMFASVTFALGVFGTLFVASAQLFGAKDNESLLSLPIRPGHILVSRILVLLTVESALSLLTLVPVVFLWVRGGYATATGLFLLALSFLLLPLLALSVSLLLAWLIAGLGRWVRYKNVLTLVLSVGFLVAYFYVYANLQNYLGDLIAHGEELGDAFRRAMPPFHAFGVAVAEGDMGRFGVFAAWAVVPFVLVTLLLSGRYLKILTTNRGVRRVEYRERAPRTSGVTAALTRKELAQYWSRPQVVLNSSIGSVMVLVGAVALLVYRDEVLAYADTLLTALPGLSVAGIAAVAVAAVGSTNNLSSSLISLEGRHLWIVRSLPVRPLTILRAKIITHLLVSAVPALVASLVFAAVLAGSPGDWVTIVAVPQAFLLLMAVGGVAVNLALPRLDWINEVQVVKQSASAMAALFGAMGVVAGLGLLYAFALRDLMTLDAYLWASAGVFVVAAAAVYLHLRRSGAERFESLAA